MDFFILHKFCSESATRLLDPKNVFELLGEADAVGLLEVALNALDLDRPVIPSPLEFTVGDAAFGGDAGWLPHGHLASVHLLEDLADFSVEGWFVDDLLLVLKFVRDHRNHDQVLRVCLLDHELVGILHEVPPCAKENFLSDRDTVVEFETVEIVDGLCLGRVQQL